MTTTNARIAYRPGAAIALSATAVAVTAGVANALISLGASALGAEPTGGLMAPAYLSLTVVAAICGAVGWHLINRSAAHPESVMRLLVPLILVVSFIPDVLVGLWSGWLTAGALMLMHVATITIAVVVYRRFMPFPAARESEAALTHAGSARQA